MISKVKSTCLIVTLVGGLCGCAATNLAYPTTSGIDRVKQKTLSPAQQKAVIKDLQGDGSAAAKNAAKNRKTAAPST